MIGVFVTFRHVDDFNEQTVRKIAEGARARFEGMPGLRSKAFTQPRHTCGYEFLRLGFGGGRQGVPYRGTAAPGDESLRSSSEHRVRADRYARGEPPLTGPVFASFRTMLGDSVGW